MRRSARLSAQLPVSVSYLPSELIHSPRRVSSKWNVGFQEAQTWNPGSLGAVTPLRISLKAVSRRNPHSRAFVSLQVSDCVSCFSRCFSPSRAAHPLTHVLFIAHVWACSAQDRRSLSHATDAPITHTSADTSTSKPRAQRVFLSESCAHDRDKLARHHEKGHRKTTNSMRRRSLITPRQ